MDEARRTGLLAVLQGALEAAQGADLDPAVLPPFLRMILDAEDQIYRWGNAGRLDPYLRDIFMSEVLGALRGMPKEERLRRRMAKNLEEAILEGRPTGVAQRGVEGDLA